MRVGVAGVPYAMRGAPSHSHASHRNLKLALESRAKRSHAIAQQATFGRTTPAAYAGALTQNTTSPQPPLQTTEHMEAGVLLSCYCFARVVASAAASRGPRLMLNLRSICTDWPRNSGDLFVYAKLPSLSPLNWMLGDLYVW